MALPGFFRRMLGHLGLRRENEDNTKRQDARRGIGGFTTKMAVPIVAADGPVISQCNYGNGGVQGLRWYSELLRADEDGDVAQEFLKESSYISARDSKTRLRLEAQKWSRPVKLKGPLCALDGNVHQFVELGGDLYWA